MKYRGLYASNPVLAEGLSVSSLSRQYAKLCDIRDFEDPALLAAISSLVPERDPLRFIERKVWEYGMLLLFLEEMRLLSEDTTALSVGAGTERVLYWLANRIGRVVATDVYGMGPFASREAPASMLATPEKYAPYAYREDRLVVRWMDARKLGLPSRMFDVVFSISSLEHFGTPDDVAAAMREMARVLKPGGYAFIVTECFVRLHPVDAVPVARFYRLRNRRVDTLGGRRRALAEIFTPAELAACVVRPSGLRPLQPLQTRLSPDCWHNVTRAVANRGLVSTTGARYPLILMSVGRSFFTSASLILQKPC